MTRHEIFDLRLYSYLITRHTGRTVRASIETQLAGCEHTVLAVLDLEHVELIDFSCADEVVAKLVTGPASAPAGRRFFLFRGISDRHAEPIESALSRQGLAAACEKVGGAPVVMGDLSSELDQAWRALWGLGRARPSRLAAHLALSLDDAVKRLDGLDARGLVIRDGDHYVSFGWALADAPDSDASTPGASGPPE